jgi:hypothetical protein
MATPCHTPLTDNLTFPPSTPSPGWSLSSRVPRVQEAARLLHHLSDAGVGLRSHAAAHQEIRSRRLHHLLRHSSHSSGETKVKGRRGARNVSVMELGKGLAKTTILTTRRVSLITLKVVFYLRNFSLYLRNFFKN